MIAVTCRNGEHFSIDPSGIERVEKTPNDTVVLMSDGAKYVLGLPFEELMVAIRDSHAAALVLRKQLFGGVAEIADAGQRAALRVERRQYRRDSPGSDEG